MIHFSFFILNIVINSFLTFFTALFLIELFLFLFRVRQGRLSACLRMIPILKLPLDLFFYNFSKWAYLHGINPLTCKEGTRTLSINIDWMHSMTTSSIQMTTPENMTFTFADMLGFFLNPLFLNSFSVLIVLCSFSFVIKQGMMYHHFSKMLPSKISQKKKRKIHNLSVKTFFLKKRCNVNIFSSFTSSPFVAGLFSPTIYIPESLSKNLSKKEYEALLAHELEHIRHNDNLIRFFLDFLRSIFFWIPTRWLLKKIDEGQEIGCDLACKKYGACPIDLASAICKSAKNVSSEKIFAHSLAKHSIHKRMNVLLQKMPPRFRKTLFVFSLFAAVISFFLVFLGKFWIF